MEMTEDLAASPGTVNYDEQPVAEAEIEGVEYRVDPGHGSAVAISRREVGTWDWVFVMEGRWDGVRLKARGLGHAIVDVLGCALARAMRGEE